MNIFQVDSIDDEPLVSIITPTFNRAKLLKKAIDSVLSQTYGNYEHIIVDDGSTDNTKEAVEPYAIKDTRIRYIGYENNMGGNYARNLALRQAKGEFIAFIDSDDEWMPNKLELQVDKFKNTLLINVGVVYGGFTIDYDGRYVVVNKEYPGKIMDLIMGGGHIPVSSNCLIKSEVFRKCGYFDEAEELRNGGNQDYEMWIRIAKEYEFDHVPGNIMIYHKHRESIGNQAGKFKRAESIEYLINKHGDVFEKYKKYYSHLLQIVGNSCCIYKDLASGKKYLKKSIKYDLFNIKSYVYLLLALFGKYTYRNIYAAYLKIFFHENI